MNSFGWKLYIKRKLLENRKRERDRDPETEGRKYRALNKH